MAIQVREEGFVVFANGEFSDFFVHRRRLTKAYEGKPLRLHMPVVDGRADRYAVTVRKVAGTQF